MTRTTDPDPTPARPLGEKVERRPVSREKSVKPRGEYGIVTDPTTGRMKTTRNPYQG